MADRHEHAGHRQLGLFTGYRVPQANSTHLRFALDLGHRGVGEEGDLLVGLRALQHDLRRPELRTPVDQGDAAREAGEERRLLHRGVPPAADDGDVLVAEEESVTGGTGAHAEADALLLTGGDTELAGRCAHGEDHRARLVCGVADRHLLDRAGQVDLVDVLHAQVRAEAQRLLAHLVHQVRAGDAVPEAGVVLHFGGGHQRATELDTFEHHGLELGSGGVHRGRVTGGARADDDHVMDLRGA